MSKKLISIAQAAKQGIERLRKPEWQIPTDHIKIDILEGGYHGPWCHLYSITNEALNGKDPHTFLIIGMRDDHSDDGHDEVWEPYEGPLPESDEYKAEVEKFNAGCADPS